MSKPESDQDKSEQSADTPAPNRAERKARSRRRILDAAREVFFRDGFMTANLDEVAEKAELAKGTLYRYFESKADLYVAVLADNAEVFGSKMSQVAAEPSSSSVETVERLSRFYLDWWTRHPDYFQIFWAIDNQAVIGDLPPQVVNEVGRIWEQSLSILERVLARGVESEELENCDPWEVAGILWTTANSLIQSDRIEARRRLSHKPLEEVFSDFIAIFLRGLHRES